MDKKQELIDYLDDLRFMLKDPNIQVVYKEVSIKPEHKVVIVGSTKIATLPETKEYTIKFTVR